jgi:hypothetical protein
MFRSYGNLQAEIYIYIYIHMFTILFCGARATINAQLSWRGVYQGVEELGLELTSLVGGNVLLLKSCLIVVTWLRVFATCGRFPWKVPTIQINRYMFRSYDHLQAEIYNGRTTVEPSMDGTCFRYSNPSLLLITLFMYLE